MSSSFCTGSFSFVLTAQWDYVDRNLKEKYRRNPYILPMDKRVNMRKATAMLLKSGKWTPYRDVVDIADHYEEGEVFPFSDERSASKRPLYKEYLYFNSNMRQLIYNQIQWKDGPDETLADRAEEYAREVEKNRQPVVVLERKLGRQGYYHLVRFKSYNGQIELTAYRLPLTSIELRLYSTGVLSLGIRCCHEFAAASSRYEKKELEPPYIPDEIPVKLKGDGWNRAEFEEDIAWIEDAGRRLFMPRGSYMENYADYPAEIPVYSCLDLGNGEEPIALCNMLGLFEKRCSCPNQACKKKIKELCSILGQTDEDKRKRQKNRILPERFEWLGELVDKHCLSKKSLRHLKRNDEGEQAVVSGKADVHPEDDDVLVIESFNDDRMYLHGTVVSDDIADNMKRALTPLDAENLMFNHHEYISTLSKWYGIISADNNWESSTCTNEKMLVELTERCTDTRWSGWGTFYGITYHCMLMLHNTGAPAYLTENMDWIYYQMFLIGILQRFSLQRFYREASGALQIHDKKDKARRSALKDSYLLFLNRIWFSEVTEQEQGRDLFHRLQENLEVKEDVAFLDQALEELSDREQKRLDSMISEQLLPMSVLGGIWAAVEMFSTVLGWTGYRNVEGIESFIQFMDKLKVLCCVVVLFVIAVHVGNYLCHRIRYWISDLRNKLHA